MLANLISPLFLQFYLILLYIEQKFFLGLLGCCFFFPSLKSVHILLSYDMLTILVHLCICYFLSMGELAGPKYCITLYILKKSLETSWFIIVLIIGEKTDSQEWQVKAQSKYNWLFPTEFQASPELFGAVSWTRETSGILACMACWG